MKKILVPTDFSDQATNALDAAVQMARSDNREIVLLHVIESPDTQSFNEMGEMAQEHPEKRVFILELMKVVKSRMTKLKEEHSDVSIKDVVKIGHPFHNISETIAEEAVDLVIMGSKGSSGLEELIQGSNSERVVRYAHCPVITIKDKVDFGNIRKIVFATDLEPNQNAVVEQLREMQGATNAELHILKVNTHSDWSTNRELESKLRDFVAENQLDNYSFTSYNARYIEDGIIQFADDIKADMIALATHGRTGIAHIIAGSVAEDLVNHSKRPIWTFSLKN